MPKGVPGSRWEPRGGCNFFLNPVALSLAGKAALQLQFFAGRGLPAHTPPPSRRSSWPDDRLTHFVTRDYLLLLLPARTTPPMAPGGLPHPPWAPGSVLHLPFTHLQRTPYISPTTSLCSPTPPPQATIAEPSPLTSSWCRRWPRWPGAGCRAHRPPQGGLSSERPCLGPWGA